jgi:glycosyltransferase involved in cell wall biosynthesis
MTSRITVVIPCYNAESHIACAVESVLRQTRAPDEIIVVDDHSTDRTVDVVSRFPVRLISLEANSGHAVARNVGIEAASGQLIAWLDADDYWEDNHLEVVAGLLDTYSDAAVACSSVRFVGSRSGQWITTFGENGPVDVFRECLRGTIVPAMSAITRRDALLRVGGFNGAIRVAPDYDLWLRLALDHLFVSTSRITANYRRWSEGQISAHPWRQGLSVLNSRLAMAAHLRSCGRSELAAEADRLSLSHWDSEMWRAWSCGNMAYLRTLLGLRKRMPSTTSTYSRMCRRAWMTPWLARVAQSAMSIRTRLSSRAVT